MRALQSLIIRERLGARQESAPPLRAFPAGGHPGRLVTLMLELYDGPSPYGQFFQHDISYVGIGLHFGP